MIDKRTIALYMLSVSITLLAAALVYISITVLTISKNVPDVLSRIDKLEPAVKEVGEIRKQIPDVLEEVKKLREQIPAVLKEVEKVNKEITLCRNSDSEWEVYQHDQGD